MPARRSCSTCCYRLLRHIYGPDHVTYVRNITDVDDKINARALRDFPGLPLNEAIRKVTREDRRRSTTRTSPRSAACRRRTSRTPPSMCRAWSTMIQKLIDKGHAYVATGGEGREVLFDVASMPQYGAAVEAPAGGAAGRRAHRRGSAQEEPRPTSCCGRSPLPSEPGWPAHFHFQGGHFDIHGRPGWHIECSVMSEAHLGQVFDIHGGGLDLIFPHHENEIAQSRCAHGTDVMANYWMHNGFLQVEGRKM